MNIRCWRCKDDISEHDEYCLICGAYQGFDMRNDQLDLDARSTQGLPLYFRLDELFHGWGLTDRFKILERYCNWVDYKMTGERSS